MMNKDHKNLEEMLRSLKSVSLSETEKSSMRGNLINFMQSDVRIADQPRPKAQSQLLTVLLNFRFMPIALGVMILLGSGVSFAAEGSLPGEILYPVKSFNEKARVVLALSGEAKAEYESKFAVRRLEEAEKLMASGSLNAEHRADLEARFEAHAEKVKAHVEEVKNKKNFEAAAEISGRLESSLNAHGRVLSFLIQSEDESAGLISAKVKIKGETAKDQRESAEVEISANANVDLEVPVRQKVASVKHKIEEVKNFIDKKRDSVRAEILVEVDAKVALAASKVIEAEAQIQAGSFKEAFLSLQEAHRVAMEAKILASASSKIEAEIERREPGPSTDLPRSERNETDLPTAVPVEVEAKIENKVDVKAGQGINLDAKIKNKLEIGL